MNGNRAALVLLAGTLALVLPGCLLLAGAAVGAGVVYAVSEDTARVDLDMSREAAFGHTLAVLEERGTVVYSKPADGLIEAEVDGSSIKARVFPVDGATRTTVRARRLGGTLPDLDLAQDLAGAVGRLNR